MTEITPDLLRQLLTYEPETGRLFWKERPPEMFAGGYHPPERRAKQWNAVNAGNEAMTSITGCGYRHGTVFSKSLKAHRVAWAIFHGRWPHGEIDHINGNRTDNRIANLRDVASTENRKNLSLFTDNPTGVFGISRRRGKWCARIGVGGQTMQIGTFSKLEDAIAARKAAEAEHGYHPNHGRTANGKL